MSIDLSTPDAALWELVKRHDEARRFVGDLGLKMTALQRKIGKSKGIERSRLIDDQIALASFIQEKKRERDEAGYLRNRAEQVLRSRGSAPMAPLPEVVAGAVKAAALAAEEQATPFFNAAQIHHLKLLATRVKSEELKLSARLQDAKAFVAIIMPLLLKEQK